MENSDIFKNSKRQDEYLESGIVKNKVQLPIGKFKVQFLPINLFGAVMGTSGLALAWQHSAHIWDLPSFIGADLGIIAIALFVVLLISYAFKALLYPRVVKDEFENPIIGNFFGTFTIAILLISSIVARYSQVLSEILWIIGAVLTLGLAYLIVRRLLVNKQDLLHATPAWLIPGVGTLDIAVAGGTIPFGYWSAEINLLSFSIGAILALVFFTLIFSRLMHHDAMPDKLIPSLMIMMAPFEVCFLAYFNIVHQIDTFATILFYFGLFLFSIFFFQIFRKGLPFNISWWAVSFPMAALSNAALKYATTKNIKGLYILAGVILAIVTVSILIIMIRTLILLIKGKLLQA